MNIVLGVSGGIAAYKTPELIRRLRDQSHQVRVVMTSAAQQFIAPLTLQAVSGYPVHDDLFDQQAEAAMGHIELARWAERLLIAPATASCLAKMANGLADDLLSTLYLATAAQVIVVPAMNQRMWQHIATQRNVAQVQQDGVQIIGPALGAQACGEFGPGRMVEPVDIIQNLNL